MEADIKSERDNFDANLRFLRPNLRLFSVVMGATYALFDGDRKTRNGHWKPHGHIGDHTGLHGDASSGSTATPKSDGGSSTGAGTHSAGTTGDGPMTGDTTGLL